MVEIEYKPVEKIVVHEIIKYDLNHFLETFAKPGPNNTQPPPARWVDGIIFNPNGFPVQTPEMVNEHLKGTIHWAAVTFAEMDEYKPIVNHPATGIGLPVNDNSNNTAVVSFVTWLKNRPEWKSGSAGA